MEKIYEDEIGIIYKKDNKIDIKLTNNDIQKKILFCLENMSKLEMLKKRFKKKKLLVLDLKIRDLEYYKSSSDIYLLRRLLSEYNENTNMIISSIKNLKKKAETISNEKVEDIKHNRFLEKFINNFSKLKTDFGVLYPSLNDFEKEICDMLEKYNLDFIILQNPIKARRINNLKPDFIIGKKILDKLKLLVIECDGEQHYNKSHIYYKEENLERDKIKETYLKNNGVSLFRVTEENYGILTNIIPQFLKSERNLYFGCYHIENNCIGKYNLQVL